MPVGSFLLARLLKAVFVFVYLILYDLPLFRGQNLCGFQLGIELDISHLCCRFTHLEYQ